MELSLGESFIITLIFSKSFEDDYGTFPLGKFYNDPHILQIFLRTVMEVSPYIWRKFHDRPHTL